LSFLSAGDHRIALVYITLITLFIEVKPFGAVLVMTRSPSECKQHNRARRLCIQQNRCHYEHKRITSHQARLLTDINSWLLYCIVYCVYYRAHSITIVENLSQKLY